MGGSLDISYGVCRDIAEKRPLGLAPWIDWLPKDHQRDCYAVAALARTLRDLLDDVDEGKISREQAREAVAFWRQWFADGCWDDVDDPIAEGVRYAVLANEIPLDLFLQYIDSLSDDLAGTRYREIGDLIGYGYMSSSTIWLATCHILGTDDDEGRARAAELGVAIRLTDVICEVGA
ncbi:MAG: squalene/phytoene synthase family protein, partial [Gemmatimonadales bacterium]